MPTASILILTALHVCTAARPGRAHQGLALNAPALRHDRQYWLYDSEVASLNDSKQDAFFSDDDMKFTTSAVIGDLVVSVPCKFGAVAFVNAAAMTVDMVELTSDLGFQSDTCMYRSSVLIDGFVVAPPFDSDDILTVDVRNSRTMKNYTLKKGQGMGNKYMASSVVAVDGMRKMVAVPMVMAHPEAPEVLVFDPTKQEAEYTKFGDPGGEGPRYMTSTVMGNAVVAVPSNAHRILVFEAGEAKLLNGYCGPGGADQDCNQNDKYRTSITVEVDGQPHVVGVPYNAWHILIIVRDPSGAWTVKRFGNYEDKASHKFTTCSAAGSLVVVAPFLSTTVKVLDIAAGTITDVSAVEAGRAPTMLRFSAAATVDNLVLLVPSHKSSRHTPVMIDAEKKEFVVFDLPPEETRAAAELDTQSLAVVGGRVVAVPRNSVAFTVIMRKTFEEIRQMMQGKASFVADESKNGSRRAMYSAEFISRGLAWQDEVGSSMVSDVVANELGEGAAVKNSHSVLGISYSGLGITAEYAEEAENFADAAQAGYADHLGIAVRSGVLEGINRGIRREMLATCLVTLCFALCVFLYVVKVMTKHTQRSMWERWLSFCNTYRYDDSKLEKQPTGDDTVMFYFLDADYLRNYDSERDPKTYPYPQMGRFQDLLRIVDKNGKAVLKHKKWAVDKLLNRVDTNDYAVVSHRWELSGNPDPNGCQQKALCAYLNDTGKDVKWLWYDYWCTPQGPGRTPCQNELYMYTLKRINLMYLSLNVVILYDKQYHGRFWTSYECWMSMRTIDPHAPPDADPIRPAQDNEKRWYVLVPNDEDEKKEKKEELRLAAEQHLEIIWWKRSKEELHVELVKEDIYVTYPSDKSLHLGIVDGLKSFVRRYVPGVAREALAVAR